MAEIELAKECNTDSECSLIHDRVLETYLESKEFGRTFNQRKKASQVRVRMISLKKVKVNVTLFEHFTQGVCHSCKTCKKPFIEMVFRLASDVIKVVIDEANFTVRRNSAQNDLS